MFSLPTLTVDNIAVFAVVGYAAGYVLLLFAAITHTIANNPTLRRFNTGMGPWELIVWCFTLAMWIVVWLIFCVGWGLVAIFGTYYLCWTLVRRFANDYAILVPLYWAHSVLIRATAADANSRVVVLPPGCQLSVVTAEDAAAESALDRKKKRFN